MAKRGDMSFKMRKYGFKPILQDNMRILFVGINPCVDCVKNGYFDNNKSFWFQLAESGITPGVINDKQIKNYGYGIMNLSDYIADDPKDVPESEWKKGIKRIERIFLKYKIDVICSIGKFPARKITTINSIDYGWSNYVLCKNKWYEGIPEQGTKIFTMMFPTYRISKENKLDISSKLKIYLNQNYEDVRNNFGQTKMCNY